MSVNTIYNPFIDRNSTWIQFKKLSYKSKILTVIASSLAFFAFSIGLKRDEAFALLARKWKIISLNDTDHANITTKKIEGTIKNVLVLPIEPPREPTKPLQPIISSQPTPSQPVEKLQPIIETSHTPENLKIPTPPPSIKIIIETPQEIPQKIQKHEKPKVEVISIEPTPTTTPLEPTFVQPITEKEQFRIAREHRACRRQQLKINDQMHFHEQYLQLLRRAGYSYPPTVLTNKAFTYDTNRPVNLHYWMNFTLGIKPKSGLTAHSPDVIEEQTRIQTLVTAIVNYPIYQEEERDFPYLFFTAPPLCPRQPEKKLIDIWKDAERFSAQGTGKILVVKINSELTKRLPFGFSPVYRLPLMTGNFRLVLENLEDLPKELIKSKRLQHLTRELEAEIEEYFKDAEYSNIRMLLRKPINDAFKVIENKISLLASTYDWLNTPLLYPNGMAENVERIDLKDLTELLDMTICRK